MRGRGRGRGRLTRRGRRGGHRSRRRLRGLFGGRSERRHELGPGGAPHRLREGGARRGDGRRLPVVGVHAERGGGRLGARPHPRLREGGPLGLSEAHGPVDARSSRFAVWLQRREALNGVFGAATQLSRNEESLHLINN